MKGFIYLLEIAIASILMVVVLSTFFVIRVKQDWDSSDLVGVGNNLLSCIKQDNSIFLGVLNKDFGGVEKLKPLNIGYGLRVIGSPKSNITIGCAQPTICTYIRNILTDTYVNGRTIEFNIVSFDIDEGIPEFIDTLVLVNYSGYSAYRSVIQDYLNGGGSVVGINATYDTNNADFNYIFGLQQGSPSGGINTFEAYDPATEDLQKYFLGIGFDTSTTLADYDSGDICLEDVHIVIEGAGGWSTSESICGLPEASGGGHYWIGRNGETGNIMVNTPSLPKDGDYVLEFNELRGESGEDYETYSVVCGSDTYYFSDNVNTEQWRWHSVTCHFNAGVNEFNFTGAGGNSTAFDGFRLTLPGGGGGSEAGAWYIWETERDVSISGSTITIENKTVDEGLLRNIPEGGRFSLEGPDYLWYSFRVKKILSGNRVNIQPMNTSFVFKDFSDSNDVTATRKILGPLSVASVASNGRAVWISDFPFSSEYAALLKSAIISRNDDWVAKGAYTTRETTTVSSFFSLCCDMPETSELDISLWYTI